MPEPTQAKQLDSHPQPAAEIPACSVLVPSCDRYRDLWTPFFSLFWRYWPDCPFPVYLGTNHASFEDARVNALRAGEDEGWSKSLRFFLTSIKTPYVLLLLEDFFLTRNVDTARIGECIEWLHEARGTVLRLFPNPPPETHLKNSCGIGSIHRRAKFRVSAQAAIWNVDELLSLLRDDESAWQFEERATIRSQGRLEGFYATINPVLRYAHVVEQGSWYWSTARRFRRENIGCDFSARAVFSPLTSFKKAVNRTLRRALHRLRAAGLRWGDRLHGTVIANGTERGSV